MSRSLRFLAKTVPKLYQNSPCLSQKPFTFIRGAIELRHPFVGDASGAQASRVGRAQIVDPKVRDLRSAQRQVFAGKRRTLTSASPSGIHSRCEDSASQGPWEWGARRGGDMRNLRV